MYEYCIVKYFRLSYLNSLIYFRLFLRLGKTRNFLLKFATPSNGNLFYWLTQMTRVNRFA